MGQYSDQATKVITKATPTLDDKGNVKKWDIEAGYLLNGYKSTYRTTIDGALMDAKPPSKFTKAELWKLCPAGQWDAIYDSQYDSVMVQKPDVVVSDFDVNALA